jgi:hypothetical protein
VYSAPEAPVVLVAPVKKKLLCISNRFVGRARAWTYYIFLLLYL